MPTKEELLGYCNHVNADEYVKNWVKNVLAKNITDEAEHIIDFLVSDKAPKRVSKMSFKEVLEATKKWDKALQKKGAKINEKEEDVELVLDFKDGFKIVKLVGKNAFEREGFLMRHCAGSYADRKDTEVYSLRDADNMPHATFEKDKQVKGKGNGDIHPKYIEYCVKFLEYTGMQVGDSEMAHLGYINIEKVKDHLHPNVLKDCFNGKYVRNNAQLIDVDGEPYSSLDLLDVMPLISVTQEKELKVNFDIPLLCRASVKWIQKKISKTSNETSSKQEQSRDHSQQSQSGDGSQQSQSGNYSRQSQSGDSSRQAQSGYSSRQAQSGHYSTQAQSGYSSQQSQSGNSSQQAQSGDGSQQSQSGDGSQQSQSGSYSRQSQSGNYSRQSQSGNYSRQSQSGNGSQQSQSGDYSRQAQSGDYSQQTQSGSYSRQSQSGDSSTQEMLGNDSVSVSSGHEGKVKGKKGCWFALTEWTYDAETQKTKPLCVKAFFIDGADVKEDVWYTLKNGELIECENS